MYEKWDALLSEDVTEIKDVAQLDLQDESLKTAIDNLDKNKTLVLCRILDNRPIESIEEAYLKLHLISYKHFLPNSLNLDNLFDCLLNVAWTNQGPVELDGIEEKILSAKINNQSLEIKSIDKFPCLTDYIIPPGVRIADASRVRLGAYLSEGTTVMHEGFVNFNAGTLGSAMIEGRISAGVVVGKNSDLGGGCSTMGTLSGGNNVKISIGENCLLGANSGLGIPIGDNCIIEAGLYLTGGSKITIYNSDSTPSTAYEALMQRETLGATGVGNGVAIPHARLAGLEKVVGAFFKLDKPMDFSSVDRKPVDLIFALFAPENAGVEHLKALALVSRTLRDDSMCSKLRANSNSTTMYAILTEKMEYKAA